MQGQCMRPSTHHEMARVCCQSKACMQCHACDTCPSKGSGPRQLRAQGTTQTYRNNLRFSVPDQPTLLRTERITSRYGSHLNLLALPFLGGASNGSVAARDLPAAPLIAQTLPAVGKNGAVRRNALRVNGAAVKPTCRCAARQECPSIEVLAMEHLHRVTQPH